MTLSRVKEVPRDLRATTTIDSIACPFDDVPTVGPDQPLEELLTEMSSGADGRVLVVDHDELVGIISPADVMRQIELGSLRDPVDLARS